MGTVTNVKVQPMAVTWAGSAIGFTDGDIEMSITEDAVDITAHQEGTNVLSTIRTGKSIEIKLVLKETQTAMMKHILGKSGNIFAASGTSTPVIAFGSYRDFTQTLNQASALIFHPVTAVASAKSEDWKFWKAYPMPESVAYSGENPTLLSVTFKIYPDSSKHAAARLGVIGDHSAGNFASASGSIT